MRHSPDGGGRAVIGLGSYAYFWQLSERTPQAFGLHDAFSATRELGVDLFQICDTESIASADDSELDALAAHARELGLTIELGTKGVAAEHLRTYLRLAQHFDARLVRSMIRFDDRIDSLDTARREIESVLDEFADAGVTLALETYELVATSDLVDLVASLDHSALGICLDPGNVVANFESPRAAVELSAPWVRNVHAKDFDFARQEGWVGFTYSGAPLGEGRHDYPHLLRTVQPRERGINEIVEHWLPWQHDADTTIRIERAWTATALDYLRSIP